MYLCVSQLCVRFTTGMELSASSPRQQTDGQEAGVCREHVNSPSQQIPINCSGAFYSGETLLSCWKTTKSGNLASHNALKKNNNNNSYTKSCADRKRRRAAFSAVQYVILRNVRVVQLNLSDLSAPLISSRGQISS